jgi:uroporphyrinogen-III synthase
MDALIILTQQFWSTPNKNPALEAGLLQTLQTKKISWIGFYSTSCSKSLYQYLVQSDNF